MPESVNVIFGRNLRQLCEERGTYAEAARSLDVSRVQLARYFRGESFPKPSQLHRICLLFRVDARILTEPLEVLRMRDAERVDLARLPLSNSRSELFPGIERYLSQPVSLPQGLHMMYRPSFTLPGRFVANPMLARHTAKGVILRGLDSPPLGLRRRLAGLFADRSFRGIAFAVPDGLVLHLYGTGQVPFLSTAYFEAGSFFSATAAMRGTYELFRPRHYSERRRVNAVICTLPQKAAAILPAWRKSGFLQPEDLPAHVRDHITEAVV